METWDVFISHASEDKKTIVEPLVKVLEENGISCWYDNNKIGWGDSLTNSINNGLKTSQYVLVVLSEAFIKKGWAKAELNSMLSMEFSNGQKKVLPLVVGDEQTCINELPLLRDKKYIVWNKKSSVVVDELKKVLDMEFSEKNKKTIEKKYLLISFLLILIGLFLFKNLGQTNTNEVVQSMTMESKGEVLYLKIENLLATSESLLAEYLKKPLIETTQTQITIEKLSQRLEKKKDSILIRSEKYIKIKTSYQNIIDKYYQFLQSCQEKTLSFSRIQKIDISLKKLRTSIEILKDIYDSEMLNIKVLKQQILINKMQKNFQDELSIITIETEKTINNMGGKLK